MNKSKYRPCGSLVHAVGRRQFMGDFLTGLRDVEFSMVP